MKLSVCATFISLSLLVGCQSTSLTSTDSSDSTSTADSSNQIESTTSSNNNTAICPVLGIQPVTVSVSDLWANGDVITDAYTGNIAQVVNGEITLTPSRHSTAPSIPTLSDLQQFSIQPNNPDALPSYWSEWQPQEGQNLTHYLDAFKNKNGDIPDWWSEAWMEGNNENAITLPAFFANKPSTKVKSSEKTKNEYLAGWMSAWVSEFGIDGFVVSNSTPELTQKIEQEGKDAFTLWNKDNAYKALENASFRVTQG
jgi:hypothetical protein